MTALDVLRAIAQIRSEQPRADEKNERNEKTLGAAGVSSFNSFNSSVSTHENANLDERAAIVEHGAGVPREWAEGFARLDPNQPPGDLPLQRWRCFVDDVGGFLDGGWAKKASALGWGPLDLFGCDRHKPFARIDRAGLLWLVNGNKLVAMSENTATIEMPTGARQTYRRRSTERGQVLAWKLSGGSSDTGER